MTPNQQNMPVKNVDVPHSVDHVVNPRDDDEIRQLEAYFANMNPKSPLSPPNIDIHARPLLRSADQRTIVLPAVRSRVDPRCDPRAIPQTASQSKVYQPTDAQTSGQFADGLSFPTQPSGVEVVSPQTTTTKPRINHQQIQQLANNHQEPWKAELINKLLRQYNKSRSLTVVSPEADFDIQFNEKKKKSFKMKVVSEDTPIVILDSDSDSNFCEIRKETKPELKPLNCQPSDAEEQRPSAIAIPPTDTTSFLRKYDFLKGYVSYCIMHFNVDNVL